MCNLFGRQFLGKNELSLRKIYIFLFVLTLQLFATSVTASRIVKQQHQDADLEFWSWGFEDDNETAVQQSQDAETPRPPTLPQLTVTTNIQDSTTMKPDIPQDIWNPISSTEPFDVHDNEVSNSEEDDEFNQSQKPYILMKKYLDSDETPLENSEAYEPSLPNHSSIFDDKMIKIIAKLLFGAQASELISPAIGQVLKNRKRRDVQMPTRSKTEDPKNPNDTNKKSPTPPTKNKNNYDYHWHHGGGPYDFYGYHDHNRYGSHGYHAHDGSHHNNDYQGHGSHNYHDQRHDYNNYGGPSQYNNHGQQGCQSHIGYPDNGYHDYHGYHGHKEYPSYLGYHYHESYPGHHDYFDHYGYHNQDKNYDDDSMEWLNYFSKLATQKDKAPSVATKAATTLTTTPKPKTNPTTDTIYMTDITGEIPANILGQIFGPYPGDKTTETIPITTAKSTVINIRSPLNSQATLSSTSRVTPPNNILTKANDGQISMGVGGGIGDGAQILLDNAMISTGTSSTSSEGYGADISSSTTPGAYTPELTTTFSWDDLFAELEKENKKRTWIPKPGGPCDPVAEAERAKVPDFKAPNRRRSEAHCREYIWSMNYRKEFKVRNETCENDKFMALGGVGISEIGGRDTELGEFPHMGALGWRNVNDEWVFRCGGSLISSKFVLTAAHCTAAVPDSNVPNASPEIVRLGDKNILNEVSQEVKPFDAKIYRSIVHPSYQSPVTYNDIALIELEDPVVFTTLIAPSCLWSKLETSYLGAEATSPGWGVIDTAKKTTSPELQVITIDILDTRVCEPLLRSSCGRNWCGFRNQICAGKLAGGIDACQGDSGGPLQVKIDKLEESEDKVDSNIHYIIGVTSFGFGCARANTPGVYTRVSSYIDWIEDIVWPEK